MVHEESTALRFYLLVAEAGNLFGLIKLYKIYPNKRMDFLQET